MWYHQFLIVIHLALIFRHIPLTLNANAEGNTKGIRNVTKSAPILLLICNLQWPSLVTMETLVSSVNGYVTVTYHTKRCRRIYFSDWEPFGASMCGLQWHSAPCQTTAHTQHFLQMLASSNTIYICTHSQCYIWILHSTRPLCHCYHIITCLWHDQNIFWTCCLVLHISIQQAYSTVFQSLSSSHTCVTITAGHSLGITMHFSQT
jgi:hypothetical protein